MNWTDKATKELLLQLSAAIGKFSNDDLINAIRTTYRYYDIELMAAEIARFVSRNTRISIVLDLMINTDHCIVESNSYFIDPQGKIKVTLT